MSPLLIGERMVQAGYITACQLRFVQAFQRGWDGRVGLEAALVKLGFLSASQVSELARTIAGDPGALPPANDAAKELASAA